MSDEPKSRVSHRVVTMRGITPTSRGGYTLSGDTPADVQVADDGIRIRFRGNRGEPWRFISWAEVWINAYPLAVEE